MKEKKGFTLIELLAVIVILAIIAVIATPIIVGLIEDARRESFERSVEMILSATDLDFGIQESLENFTYVIENGEVTNTTLKAPIQNLNGFSGVIKYDEKGNSVFALYNGSLCSIKNSDGSTELKDYVEGECEYIEYTDASCFSFATVGENKYTISDVTKCQAFAVDEWEATEEESVSICNNEAEVLGSGLTLIEYLETAGDDEILDVQDLLLTQVVTLNPAYSYEIVDKDACETFIVDSWGYSEEFATKYCNGETITLIDDINSIVDNYQDMIDANVISLNASNKYEFTSTDSCINHLSSEWGLGGYTSEFYCNGGEYHLPLTKYLSMHNEQHSGYKFDVLPLIDSNAVKQNVNADIRIVDFDTSCGTEAIIAPTMNNLKVVEIGANAFAGKNLTKISIPNTVTYIGDEAFASNQLSNAKLHNDVELGLCVFEGNPDGFAGTQNGTTFDSNYNCGDN